MNDKELNNSLIIAFIQGAKWWEYHQSKCTMWASDRNLAEAEAKIMLGLGNLGKSKFPNIAKGHS